MKNNNIKILKLFISDLGSESNSKDNSIFDFSLIDKSLNNDQNLHTKQCINKKESKFIGHHEYPLLIKEIKTKYDLKCHEDKNILNSLIKSNGDFQLAFKYLSNKAVNCCHYHDCHKFN